MEAAGIAPASREASVRASTCVADRLIVGLGAPVGRVSFGLSCHEFNPSRNKRLGSGDPELSSPAGSLGRRPGARPLLWFRQRDGTAHQRCWQLSFGRLFTRPADQPRHATSRFGHPVDPGSPPIIQKRNSTEPCAQLLALFGLTTRSQAGLRMTRKRGNPIERIGLSNWSMMIQSGDAY